MTPEAPQLALVAFSCALGSSSVISFAQHKLELMQNTHCVNTVVMSLAITAFLELMFLETTLPRTVARSCRKTVHFWNTTELLHNV